MELLLALLSVLAGWALLAVLLVGLVRVLKALEGVRASLQRIAMGVRAIEQETQPLRPALERLAANLTGTVEAFDGSHPAAAGGQRAGADVERHPAGR